MGAAGGLNSTKNRSLFQRIFDLPLQGDDSPIRQHSSYVLSKHPLPCIVLPGCSRHTWALLDISYKPKCDTRRHTTHCVILASPFCICRGLSVCEDSSAYISHQCRRPGSGLEPGIRLAERKVFKSCEGDKRLAQVMALPPYCRPMKAVLDVAKNRSS